MSTPSSGPSGELTRPLSDGALLCASTSAGKAKQAAAMADAAKALRTNPIVASHKSRRLPPKVVGSVDGRFPCRKPAGLFQLRRLGRPPVQAVDLMSDTRE